METSREEFARLCASWSDEYLAEHFALGPGSYASPASWEVLRAEVEHRRLSPEVIAYAMQRAAGDPHAEPPTLTYECLAV